jgi:hypothetical protein
MDVPKEMSLVTGTAFTKQHDGPARMKAAAITDLQRDRRGAALHSSIMWRTSHFLGQK